MLKSEKIQKHYLLELKLTYNLWDCIFHCSLPFSTLVGVQWPRDVGCLIEILRLDQKADMMYLSEGSKHVWFTDTASVTNNKKEQRSTKKNTVYTRITLAANTTTTIFPFIHLGLMTANHTMAYHCKSLHPVKQKKHNALQPHQAPVVKKNQRVLALTHIKLRMKHAKGSQLESWRKVTLGTAPGLLRIECYILNLWSGSSVFINIYDQLVVFYILHILYIPYKLQSM